MGTIATLLVSGEYFACDNFAITECKAVGNWFGVHISYLFNFILSNYVFCIYLHAFNTMQFTMLCQIPLNEPEKLR